MRPITDIIGLPAMLEQLAEECTELAQASLKYARKLRGDNPTPKDYPELDASLTEELSDVLLCIGLLAPKGIGPDKAQQDYKTMRCYQRLREAGKQVDG